MHKSLAPKSNIALALVWIAIVVAGLVMHATPSRLLVIAAGVALGVIAGVLQLRAMEEKNELFLAAASALEVRGAMQASLSGRLAIYSVWSAGALVLAISLWQQEGLLLRVLVGYAAFAAARDTIAIKGCISLQRAYEAKKANQ
jgi:hypothetical protein